MDLSLYDKHQQSIALRLEADGSELDLRNQLCSAACAQNSTIRLPPCSERKVCSHITLAPDFTNSYKAASFGCEESEGGRCSDCQRFSTECTHLPASGQSMPLVFANPLQSALVTHDLGSHTGQHFMTSVPIYLHPLHDLQTREQDFLRGTIKAPVETLTRTLDTGVQAALQRYFMPQTQYLREGVSPGISPLAPPFEPKPIRYSLSQPSSMVSEASPMVNKAVHHRDMSISSLLNP